MHMWTSMKYCEFIIFKPEFKKTVDTIFATLGYIGPIMNSSISCILPSIWYYRIGTFAELHVYKYA